MVRSLYAQIFHLLEGEIETDETGMKETGTDETEMKETGIDEKEMKETG